MAITEVDYGVNPTDVASPVVAVYGLAELAEGHTPNTGDIITGLDSARQIDFFEVCVAKMIREEFRDEPGVSQISTRRLSTYFRTQPESNGPLPPFCGDLIGGQALVLPLQGKDDEDAIRAIQLALCVGQYSSGKGVIRTVSRGVVYEPRDNSRRSHDDYVKRQTFSRQWVGQQGGFIEEVADDQNPWHLVAQGMQRAILAGLPELVGKPRSSVVTAR